MNNTNLDKNGLDTGHEHFLSGQPHSDFNSVTFQSQKIVISAHHSIISTRYPSHSHT